MKNSQEIAILVKELAKNKKMAIKDLLENSGLSKNALSSMQSGGYFPRLDSIVKLAENLNVSVDYLLGLSEEKSQHQNNAGHNRLLELYDELNAEGKEKLLDYADDLVESGKYKKDSQISTAAV